MTTAQKALPMRSSSQLSGDEPLYREGLASVGDLAEEVDLHDKLMKGLYEVGATACPSLSA